MERIVHRLVQGSPEWDAFRFEHDGASEIKAVMGLDKKTTREQLLRMKVSGTVKEFSAWVQENILDPGHEVEALARPFAVEFAGVDGFYPATVSIGRISASCDGLDMLDETAWECKKLNKENGPIVRAGRVPEEHMPQCQQVLMVTGADRLLFTVTDGTRENTFHTWVEPDTDWFDRIRAAWRLFNEERANYRHEDLPPEPVRKVVPTLPSLVLDFEGAVTVKSNIAAFEAVVQARIDAVPAIFETDQEFDDAKADVKFLKEDVEDALEAALAQFLKKNEPIQTVIDAVRRLQEKSRNKRLPLANAVKNQLETINIKILTRYEDEFAAWLKAQNDSLSTKQALLPAMKPDFALAIKNKRLISSRHDACKQVMSNAKLAIGDAYTRIQTNMAMMREKADKHGFLFQDAKAIVNMDPVAAEAVVKQRISEYEAAEQKKRDDAAAAEKRRNAMSEIQAIQHQVVIAQIGRLGVRAGGTVECMQETLAETRAWIIDDRFGELIDSALQAKTDAIAAIELMIRNAEAQALEVATTLPADPVSQEPAPVEQQSAEQAPQAQASALAAPAAGNVVKRSFSPPTMTNGKVCQILGFTVTAEFLTSIGAPAPTKQGNANLWHERQIIDILEALGVHMTKVYAEQKAKWQPARSRTAA